MAATIVVIIDDLFFLSKVQQVAVNLGISVTSALPAKVMEVTEAVQPGGIIVDLNCRGGSALAAVRSLKSSPSKALIPIVGFVSHVQSDLIAAARAAGCDQVLARSAFSRDLPQLLARLATPPSSSPAKS